MSPPDRARVTSVSGSFAVGRTTVSAELRAELPGRDASILIGRDALGNVLVTGDGNTVDVKLTVVVADTRLQSSAASTHRNPYRGLDAFRETDSALFFGREDVIARLWTRFHMLQRGAAPRLLPILGASGSGKSSLVRAGLLPELVRQPMDGMRDPIVLVLRPGSNPLQRLADVLTRATHDAGRSEDHGPPPDALDTLHRAARGLGDADRRVVLFIDQLEELFTECVSDAARTAFLATLAHAAAQPDGLVSVIFAMRNDFAGSLRTHDAFAVAVREHRFTVSQMFRDQLVHAIEQPAAVLGHPWPHGLVENLVLQCEGRSGALPLLQFALKRLWSEHVTGRLSERRWSSRLIEDFVVQVADTLFECAGQENDRAAHQRIIRRAFIAMVQLGEGTADTRRMARLTELVARGETGEQVRAVLTPFLAPEARLIMVSELDGEPTYELAHEALIASWDRLREWLGRVPSKADAETIRAELRLRRQLQHAAEAWRTDPEARWQPPELTLAAQLRGRDPDELSALEHEFIDASLTAWHANRRLRHRVRLTMGALAIVFGVVVSILAVIASRKASEAQRWVARSVQIYQDEGGERLLVAERPMQALPYLVAARESAEKVGQEPRESLRMLFAQAARAVPVMPPLRHQGVMWVAAFSPDGKRIVTASEDDHTARIWDSASGNALPLPALEHEARVTTAAFSANGSRIVTASDDNTARIWDADTAKRIVLKHDGPVNTAVFNPEGTLVVTASGDTTARIWDAKTGAQLFILQHQDAVNNAVFSPDGTLVVTASKDKTACVWDVVKRKRLLCLPHSDGVYDAALSRDNKLVVTASDDARIWDVSSGITAREDGRTWDVASGTPTKRLGQHRGIVLSVTFSRDGKRVVTAGVDGTARIWDMASNTSRKLQHQALVWRAAFSPDGTRVATVSNDATARIWDAVSGKPLSPPLEHRSIVWRVAFNRDGDRVVTAGYDGTARIWNAAIAPPLSRSLPHNGPVRTARFSLGGGYVVTASKDGTARIWDLTSGTARSLPHPQAVISAAVSSDSTRVVTICEDKMLRIWKLAPGALKPVLELEHPGNVWSAAFSPDGTRVVTAGDDGTARIWDATAQIWDTAARKEAPVRSLRHPQALRSAAFSADGTRIVTASIDGTARIWSAASGVELGVIRLQHQTQIWSAAFSPDGTRIVTADEDFTVRVWDAASGKQLSLALAHSKTTRSAAFSPDGTRVVSASDDGTARVWDAASGAPLSPPLEHDGAIVRSAEFSPDGTRVVTAADDGTARIWDLPLATGTLEQWRDIVNRASPYQLVNGALSPR